MCFSEGLVPATFASSVQVSGTQVYDETKVAAVAAVVTPVLLLLSGVGACWSLLQLFWLGMVLPGVGAATWAR